MPHLILEYSSNIVEKEDFSDYFENAHNLLVEKISTNINACKSRAIKCNNYYLGDGNINNAFIHLTLKILSGRSEEMKTEIANALIDLTKDNFSKSLAAFNLKISIEVADLQTYFKTS